MDVCTRCKKPLTGKILAYNGLLFDTVACVCDYAWLQAIHRGSKLGYQQVCAIALKETEEINAEDIGITTGGNEMKYINEPKPTKFVDGYLVTELRKEPITMQVNTNRIEVSINHSLVKVLKKFDIAQHTEQLIVGYDYMIATDKLEILVQDLFKIGDDVYTDHTMQGIVVGFEPHSNSVIVKSNLIDNYDNKFTRYAYKPALLHKGKKLDITLKIGTKYSIYFDKKKTTMCCAIEHPYSTDTVLLVDNNGQIICATPIKTSVNNLKVLVKNLTNIKEV